MQSYKFTIIIPHKNIPSLLRRCLDSIPQRDDVQIIVVDDNSDADKVNFVQFPGFGEKNIEVYFTKEGKGAGYARNVGLSHAKGEWVLFADADDMFLPEIEKVFEYCEDSDAELIYYDICSKDSETLVDNDKGDFYNTHIHNSIKKLCSMKYKVQVPWGKVIRLSFINEHKIRFEEVLYGNDAKFATLLDFYAQNIQVTPMKTYCWMTRKDSLWNQNNIEWAKTRFGVHLRLAQFMKNKEEKEAYDNLLICTHYYLSCIKQFSTYSYVKHYILYIKVKGLNEVLKSFFNRFTASTSE